MRTIAALICLLAAIVAPPAFAQQPCPTLVVSTNDDVANGDISSPCALIANPGGDGISLREALLAANNAAGSGTVTVTFAPGLAGATIALAERFAPITRSQITLAGLTSNGQPDITLDAGGAGNPGAIFFVAASTFTMTGINIKNLPANFNGMQIGGSGFSLTGQQVTSPAQICCFAIDGNAFSDGTASNTFAIYVAANVSNELISDVTIADNSFSQLFEGVNIQGGGGAVNSLIQDVMIFGNVFAQMTSNATSAVELGDTSGTNNTIKNVQIVQNTFTGNFQGAVLDINGTTSASSIQNTTIARNVFSGNLQALGVAAGVDPGSNNNTVTNTQIVDNLIDLNGFQGGGAATIQIIDSQSGGANDKVTGISFVNNTIYNSVATGGPPGWGVWVTSSGGVSGVTISNDIFWGSTFSSPALNGVTASQVSYSIINQSGFNGVNHDINADPLFVNSAGGNFELQSGSPARSAGIAAGAPAIDIACQPRGTAPSIGAYEFQGPDICASTATSNALTDSHHFNGDGHGDILWRDNNGNVAMWLMNGAQILSSSGVGGAPGVWSIVGQRDFNGDGTADLLWRDTNGNVAMWFMSGASVIGSGGVGNAPIIWSIAGTGDFNGDGISDILWHDTSGNVAMWMMNGAAILQSAGVGNANPTVWSIAETGDFNGDGTSDILWRDASGNVAVWEMNGAAISQSAGIGNASASVWTIQGLNAD